MAVQTKTWMTSFLFKEFLSIFKKSILGGIFPSNHHLLIINGHGSHVNLEAIEQAQQFELYMITLPSHNPPCFTTSRCELFQALQNNFQKRKR